MRKIKETGSAVPEIALDGAKLFYDVSGTGEPILLIPGLGSRVSCRAGDRAPKP